MEGGREGGREGKERREEKGANKRGDKVSAVRRGRVEEREERCCLIGSSFPRSLSSEVSRW